jgi:hypothetical protein
MEHLYNEPHRRPLLLPAVVIVALVISGCDESLPPRELPAVYLTAKITALGGAVLVENDTPMPEGGISTPRGSLTINLYNSYTEILSDIAFVRARVHVDFDEFPGNPGTMEASGTNLIQNKSILNEHGTIVATLPPWEPARYLVVWDHRNQAGIPAWQVAPVIDSGYMEYQRTIRKYYQTDSLHFTAWGKVQLFRDVPMTPTDTVRFSLTYRIIL